MQFIDKKIKLSTIFPYKRISNGNINSHFNIKVIPPYIENEETLMKRKLILRAHKVFENEKQNKYKKLYLNEIFTGLYENKRNYSHQRNQLYETNFSRNKSLSTFPVQTTASAYSSLASQQINSSKPPILKNRSCSKKDVRGGKKVLFQKYSFPPIKCF